MYSNDMNQAIKAFLPGMHQDIKVLILEYAIMYKFDDCRKELYTMFASVCDQWL